MSIATPAFSAYAGLMHIFLDQQTEIVTSIERLLNCQKKPAEYHQNLRLQSQLFMECFLVLPGLTREQQALPGLLEKARWNSGLKPRDNPGNDIVDPVQQLLRAYHFWQQTRWPGQKGRLRYAHTLFNLTLIRFLTQLTLRLWDENDEGSKGNTEASTRLSQLQTILDQLWKQAPENQPRLVRDVRWLIPVALSPTTDDLSGYFEYATRIADTFPEQDRVETQKAWVQTGAGHLCSQLRHLSVKRAVPVDANELVLITRKSNALDVCLLMEGLVTLFRAYAQACASGNKQQRHSLATAICQAVSPDPELYLLRLDLLAPYAMIEHLFITSEANGQASYTETGLRHLRLLREYRDLLQDLAQCLYEDSPACRPVEGSYSPYGALFGFSSNLLELMAFKTLQFEPATPYSMEDIFTAGSADKRAWVNGWRQLPHINKDVSRQFEYPEEFAQTLHARVEKALESCASSSGEVTNPCGRLFIADENSEQPDTIPQQIPELPAHYVSTSDPQLAEAGIAVAQNEEDLLHCRLEGEFLVSYSTPQGWVGISKDFLTEVLGTGRDVKITVLPAAAARVLNLMCGEGDKGDGGIHF